MALSLGSACSRRRARVVLAGDRSLDARATVYMLLVGADRKHHARDGGVHHQGLQRAAQRGLALGIDEHGPGHDYMRVLARRCGAHLALRVLTRRVLFSQPVLLATMSFFHGSNAIGVEADPPHDGSECKRDRAMTYSACRAAA